MLRIGVISGLLCLGLAGCDQEQQGVDTPRTVMAQPSNDKEPIEATVSYQITADAAGPVQLGMQSADVLAVLPNATGSIEQDAEGIEWMTLRMESEVLMNLVLDRNMVALIRVLSPRFSTKQGVKVGENLQSAGEKLGGLTEIQWTEIESREFATFGNTPPNLAFQVISDDQGADGVKEGTAGIYANGETITSHASSAAVIHSIWIMEN